MFMPKLFSALSLGVLLSSGLVAQETPLLGKPISEAELQGWDLIVSTDGEGLPPGNGTAVQGKGVYEQQCAACHGLEGQGGAGVPGLVGGSTTAKPAVLTVGSYWPYTSTLYDYVRRAMPPTAPKSLSDTQVYQVVAYVLYLNGLVDEDIVVDSASLPKIEMPNHAGFIDQSQVQ
jgi:cytochrome c